MDKPQIDEEQRILTKSSGIGVQDLLLRQLAEANKYYAFARIQSTVVLVTSLIMIVAGLGINAFAVLSILSNPTSSATAYLSGAGGLILDFIGGTMLVLHQRSAQQMNHFQDKLNSTQNHMLALDALNNYADEQKREEKLGQIIDSLIHQ